MVASSKPPFYELFFDPIFFFWGGMLSAGSYFNRFGALNIFWGNYFSDRMMQGITLLRLKQKNAYFLLCWTNKQKKTDEQNSMHGCKGLVGATIP